MVFTNGIVRLKRHAGYADRWAAIPRPVKPPATAGQSAKRSLSRRVGGKREKENSMERMVKNRHTGEVFIETSVEDWQARLQAWWADRSLPCPMPIEHCMFENPEVYNSFYVKSAAQQSVQLTAFSVGTQSSNSLQSSFIAEESPAKSSGN